MNGFDESYTKLVQTADSRVYSHITEDDNWAIVSPYRSESDDSTNKKLMSHFKREVRDSGYGFIQFVSRWVGNGETVDESSLLIPDCAKEDALGFGKKYRQRSVIVRDDSGCNEICTTEFKDENTNFSYGDIVRSYYFDEVETIFSIRLCGPASMPEKKTGRNDLMPFSFFEVYEISQPRPSYFQNGKRQSLIIKSSL